MTTMKHTILILLASAGLACADDLQRWLDQQQLENELRHQRWEMEDQQRHLDWEARDREAREQQNDYSYKWAE